MTARFWLVILLGVVGLGFGGLAVWRAEGGDPSLEAPDSIAVGRAGRDLEIGIEDDGSGLRAFRATLRHSGGEEALVEEDYPGSLMAGGTFAGAKRVAVKLDPKALRLAEGDAFLVLSARDWSWRDGFGGNETLVEVPVRIDLSAPRVSVMSGLTYVKRGGAGAVAYTLSEEVERDGVEVGDRFFPGFAVPPGDPARRVALFAIATDAPEKPEVRVVAEDAAGNATRAGWALVVQEKKLPRADVRLPESFLEGRARPLAEAQGIDTADLVKAFDRVNTQVRAANEAKIREAVSDTAAERLFDGSFAQLENSKVTSRFAEQRTYFIAGSPVSKATHFGYDLASTASAPITAGNAGRVVFAGDLGIYGNCVLIDHGLGVSSLYGHLSTLEVSAGESVEKGQPLGRSGATGLAGGDHLHFAILVGGVYVDPLEWWDREWVRTHVDVAIASP